MVQSLLELICDLKAMEECVLEMKFDIRKAPLGCSGLNIKLKLQLFVMLSSNLQISSVGKLTSDQIRAGYAALKKIEDCLKRKGGHKELLEACNLFYTRIPHNSG